MSTWDARTTGRPLTWMLRRDGVEAAMVSVLDNVALPELFIGAVVHGLNHPPQLEGFGGPGGDMLAARRAQQQSAGRSKHPSGRGRDA